jgi:hypothetical protein
MSYSGAPTALWSPWGRRPQKVRVDAAVPTGPSAQRKELTDPAGRCRLRIRRTV